MTPPGWASITSTRWKSTCRATGKIEKNLVTDPYSVSLSMNSLRSQIVDLGDAALKPTGWDALVKPSAGCT